MAIISNTALQHIGDKLALWAATSVGDAAFNNAFTAGMETANLNIMSGSNSLFQYLADLASTDADPAADMLNAARNLDETNPTPPSRFLFGIPGVSAFLAALNTHLVRYSPTTANLDAYLTSLNASAPTLRFHEAFHNHLKALSRANVFVGVDTVLATFAATAATTGTYTHVTALPSYVAGAKIVVKNQGAVTTGATLTVTGKKLDLTTASLTATIATGTDNFETNLSSVLKLFYDVTAISITGGTNANVYEIVAKTDRDITGA